MAGYRNTQHSKPEGYLLEKNYYVVVIGTKFCSIASTVSDIENLRCVKKHKSLVSNVLKGIIRQYFLHLQRMPI